MNEKERNDEQLRLILAEDKATTQAEKDIIHLKQIALSIRPYSCWWRWGYLGSLRRAIKILEKEVQRVQRETETHTGQSAPTGL